MVPILQVSTLLPLQRSGLLLCCQRTELTIQPRSITRVSRHWEKNMLEGLEPSRLSAAFLQDLVWNSTIRVIACCTRHGCRHASTYSAIACLKIMFKLAALKKPIKRRRSFTSVYFVTDRALTTS